MAGGIPSSFGIGTKVTPQQAAANYTAGASTKGPKWATNYLHSKTDPFEAAAAASTTWLAKLNSVGEAGFKAGLGRVNKQQVADLVSKQGPALYAAGIQNKGSIRYATAATGLIPALQQAAANLPARGSDAQNEQRAVLMIRAAKAMRNLYRSR